MNKKAIRKLSYGVYIISTTEGEKPTGCTANSAMQITSDPATIAISINHDNYTNTCISKSEMFSIGILPEDVDISIIGNFGFQSGKEVDKYENIPYKMIEGLPVPDAACAYMICKVVDSFETSSHTVFLGELIEADVYNDKNPMTYAHYHDVKNGRSPEKSPIYVPEDESGDKQEEKWVCSVCGYIYDGDVPFEELPEDYKCPVCKAPKNKFEKKTA